VRPVDHVRRAGEALIAAGATEVAGHSAHDFHGVEGAVLYYLGDFLDDYATDQILRNDLGLLFVVTLGPAGLNRLKAIPLPLDFCYTRLATGDEEAWVRAGFVAPARSLGRRLRSIPAGSWSTTADHRARSALTPTSRPVCQHDRGTKGLRTWLPQLDLRANECSKGSVAGVRRARLVMGSARGAGCFGRLRPVGWPRKLDLAGQAVSVGRRCQRQGARKAR
jgi:hypothetical protein